jgi:hypothetical protein
MVGILLVTTIFWSVLFDLLYLHTYLDNMISAACTTRKCWPYFSEMRICLKNYVTLTKRLLRIKNFTNYVYGYGYLTYIVSVL